MSNGLGRAVMPKYEQEDLGDVMKALEVVEHWVRTQDLDDNIRKLGFPAVKLLICLIFGIFRFNG